MKGRLVIVGAGFSGAVVAANVLRRPPDDISEIVLIERSADLCRGAAYAKHAFPFLLNVPTGRLSADSSQPLQFLEFARRTLPLTTAEDFLPRRLYGDYLDEFLREAERASPDMRLITMRENVTEVTRRPDGVLGVGFAAREALSARRVILALGNPPQFTPSWAESIQSHPAYHGDPFNLPTGLSPDSVVLVVGNGLTMMDVAYSLTAGDMSSFPRIVTISRRGLIPQPQSEFHVDSQQDGFEVLEQAHTIRELVSATRRLSRETTRRGGDWREVVTFIRNHVPRIWQRLPAVEKRRFVRHVQGHWDVHRHRLPTRLAAHVEGLRASGRLRISAGRISRAEPEGNRLRVSWQDRGGTAESSMLTDAVIMATGPDFVLRRSSNSLLKRLHGSGMICSDELELGLVTTPALACVKRDGTASDDLFYLGPMLRASYWETTAAAELRNHAERLARHLNQLGKGSETGITPRGH